MWMYKNNTFISYLIILVSLFILILVTKNQIFNLVEQLDQKEASLKEYEDTKVELVRINKLKTQWKDTSGEVDKYMIDLSENELIDYFYGYSDNIESSDEIKFKSISFTEWKENEIGFNESNISLTIMVANEMVLKNFISHLLSEDAKYKFFVDSFSFPNDWREWGYIINLPLKIFYR